MHVTHQTQADLSIMWMMQAKAQTGKPYSLVMPLIKTKAHTGRPQCNAIDQSQSSHKHRQTSVQCHWPRPKLTQGSQTKLRKAQADLSLTQLTEAKTERAESVDAVNFMVHMMLALDCVCPRLLSCDDHSPLKIQSPSPPPHGKTKPVLRFIPQYTHDSI